MDATTRSLMRMVFIDFTISRGNFYGFEFLWTRRFRFFERTSALRKTMTGTART